MGGTIRVQSTEGVGSVFLVTIPFETHDIPLAGQAPARPVRSKIWSGPPLRILLAEDNEISRNFIVDLLQRHGHSLVAAKNGMEAVEKWEKGTFNILLLDVQMPEMDGSEALRIIREREQASGQHTPAIALTAHTLREDQGRLLNEGFDGYVSKPIDLDALNREMQRCAGIVPGGES
jgi:two-component system CheB/CheR fusion protein